MYPTIEIFGKQIGTYPLLAAAGFLIAGLLACICAKKRKEDENDMIVFFLVAAVGALVGSHLLYGITNFHFIIELFQNLSIITSFQKFIQILLMIFGGSVFYGGLLGGGLFCFIYLRKKKLNPSFYWDVAAFSVPLFHTFGRIGCFLGGCCYGIECSWGLTYTQSLVTPANNVPRFPIQLLEAALNLMLFVLIFLLFQKQKLKGRLIFVYLTCYPVIRFVLEFFRGDAYRGFLWRLSTSQIISLLILLAELIYFILFYIKSKKENFLV